jgi:hypothetical protein
VAAALAAALALDWALRRRQPQYHGGLAASQAGRWREQQQQQQKRS